MEEDGKEEWVKKKNCENTDRRAGVKRIESKEETTFTGMCQVGGHADST